MFLPNSLTKLLLAIAIAFKVAEEGAYFSLVGRSQEKLNNVAKKCRNPLIIEPDLNKDQDADRIVKDTVKHFGKLDVLVNNAGIVGSAYITDEHAMRVFDQVITTNLRVPELITNLAAPYLIKTKGNIINI